MRRFAVQAAIALSAFTVVVFVGIFWQTQALVESAARDQAASYVDLIVNARAWNALHGGVWVVKGPGVESNPYLRSLGVEPDTSTVSGTQLTLRNPAAMTRELAHIAQTSEGIHFRLTSLNVVNPDNAPDVWERSVLGSFETSSAQVFTKATVDGERVLRIMRPLVTDDACMSCHGAQGYEVGDVRGAISLTLPLARSDEAIRASGAALSAICLAVIMVGGAIGYGLFARMQRRVDETQNTLNTLASTDPLTGVANRRAVVERLEAELARGARRDYAVGVIEFDIDHFKDVNDSHGHAAGDEVLKAMTARVLAVLREYDVSGRLGGEEFLVVAPDVTRDSLLVLAERVRQAVGESPMTHAGHVIGVTISVGATLSRGDDSAESALARADGALYAAKGAGRNRVVIA